MKNIFAVALILTQSILVSANCPQYQKRDISGNCVLQTCQYTEVRLRDGARQGECNKCSTNTVPDSLQQNCIPCTASQTVATRSNFQTGGQELYCTCGGRSFQNQAGTCQQCADYMCPPNFGSIDRCMVPACGSDSIILRSCQCQRCPNGQRPDPQQRICQGQGQVAAAACPEWTRRQFSGNCASDSCFQGQQLIQFGNGQGTCIQCPPGRSSTFNYRGCQTTACPFGQVRQGNGLCQNTACPTGQVRQNGNCQTCGPSQQPDASGTYCQTIGCPAYTRRQINNQCEPDRCRISEQNIQYTTFVQGLNQEQGRCLRCTTGSVASQPDPQNYNARTSCIAPSCQANEIVTSTGSCQACGSCEESVNQQQCIAKQCFGNQILRKFGNSNSQTCQCEPCPPYDTPNASKTKCERCPKDSYINASNTCVRCPNYPRESQSPDAKSCVGTTCGSRQFVNNNGDCQTCAAYQVSDGSRCYEPDCGLRQIVNANGALEECPTYSKMITDTQGNKCRKCGESKCVERQYLTSFGDCQECGDYTVADPTRRECIVPKCPQNSVITRTGGCQPCERGTNPDQTQRQCDQVFCGARQRIVQKNNVTDCVECSAGTRAQESNTVCRADPCDLSKKRFTRDDGICQQCPAYQIVNAAKTQCIYPTCAANEVVTEAGICQACPKYQKRFDNGPGFGNDPFRYQCQQCQCTYGQFCQEDGECKACPEFTIPSDDGRSCKRPDCAQVVNKDGSCGNCEQYHYFDKTDKKCKPKVCDARSKVTIEGGCVKCQNFFYVTENKKDCQYCNCGPREICQEDGSCKKCDDFEIVGTTGEDAGKCVKAACANGVLSREGVCTNCGWCESLNKDKTKCEKPKCDNRSVLSYEGKCVECAKHTGPRLLDGEQCGATCQTCQAQGRQYVKEDGDCDICPNYSQISQDRKKCEKVPCKGNSIVSQEGFCNACPEYTLADADQRECKPVQCKESEILQKDGKCIACAKYKRADPTGRVCIQSACNDREYFDDKGFCKECAGCSRTSLETLRLECFADECGAGQIQLPDGQCQNCPAYTIPTDAEGSKGKCGQVCKRPDCATTEIVLENGKCDACPSWTKPSEDGKVCGPGLCAGREKLLISGHCEECSEYYRGGGQMEKGQFTDCKQDQCEQNQVLTKSGTCAFCKPYESAKADGKTCAIPSCGDRTKKLLPSATFEDCPEYSRATENCRQCAPDPCTLRQKLLKTGKCEDCDAYMRATADGRDCRMPVCEKNQILLENGSCQDCPPFQRKSPNGRQCKEVQCSQTQRLLPSGECEDCEPYSRALAGGKACAPMLCTQRQKIMPDGTCEDCPPFTRTTPDHRGCANQVCTARQVLQKDGRCAECYPYTRADAQGKTCIPHNCNDRQKLGPDGSCIDCPDFERAQGTGITCGPDQCNIRQRIQRDGTCVYCELFHAVCSNRRCCTKPTCKPMVEYITMDGVCGACEFYQQTGPDGTTCVTDPTKKLPDPQIMAPRPITLQSAPPPAKGKTAGYDVWTDEQFLSEDRATGFYLNQQTGNWGFILGSVGKLSTTMATVGTALFIALNAF